MECGTERPSAEHVVKESSAPILQLVAFEARIVAALEDQGCKRDDHLDSECDQEKIHTRDKCSRRAG